MKIRALPTQHDLPPLWDGHRVEWKPWTTFWSTLDFHMKPDTCSFCGAREKCALTMGLVQPLPGETVTRTVYQRSKRVQGREFGVNRTVAETPIYWLVAFRCPSCHHDSVWDRRTDEWWDLDEQDYGDEGSTDGMLF